MDFHPQKAPLCSSSTEAFVLLVVLESSRKGKYCMSCTSAAGIKTVVRSETSPNQTFSEGSIDLLQATLLPQLALRSVHCHAAVLLVGTRLTYHFSLNTCTCTANCQRMWTSPRGINEPSFSYWYRSTLKP